ncbi:hypothetical protein [Aeromonas veronii]|uniref:hypothetical protein n=1 Tax=Aeromonas veronii TaxID=654 RepID=UPI003D1D94E4
MWILFALIMMVVALKAFSFNFILTLFPFAALANPAGAIWMTLWHSAFSLSWLDLLLWRLISCFDCSIALQVNA